MTATTLLRHLKLLPSPEPQSVLDARHEVLRVTHWRHLVEAAHLVLEAGAGVTPRCVVELQASLAAADQLLAVDLADAERVLERELAEWRDGQSGEGQS